MKPFSYEDNDEEEIQAIGPFEQFQFETFKALLDDRTILFTGDVTDNIVERVVLPLTTLSQQNNKPIKLLIHSEGGSVEAGQIVVDAILTSKAPIITVALGMAMSAAFDIFLAGDRRIAYPNTLLMAHSGSAMLDKQTLPALGVEAELHKAYFTRWSKWYASRTKVSEKDWFTLLNGGLNKYYFPDEALKLGIIHEIIPHQKKSIVNLKKYKYI